MSVIFESSPIIGSIVRIRMQLPMNMLVTIAQKICGCCIISVGPGVTPCSMNAPSINAITTLSGRPRVRSGIKPLQVAAFAADFRRGYAGDGAWPNFWLCLPQRFATA